jgi:4-hydroxymandelate oxidase
MWLDELERSAAASLEEYVREYFAAVAGDPGRYREALAEWDAIRFRPRALRGQRDLSPATTVLGQHVATPVLVAPMANQVAADPRGEAATAEAAQRTGTLLGVSTNTAVAFERIAAAGAPWWFQVYLLPDRDLTQRLVERAAAAGATALILTVDLTPLVVPHSGDWPDLPGKVRLGNLTAAERELLESVWKTTDASLDDIEWLHRVSGLPVVVKGILRADDAAAAVDAGARGVIVSTHGGRRMGDSVSSLAALPEVVSAVANRCEVYVDSGVRSGSHVLAALALGARAVFVGRPVMWGLATAGADGAASVIERLTAEFVGSLAASGVRDLADVTPDLVVRPGA